MVYLKYLEILTFMFFAALSLKVIPESLKVTYSNNKYVSDVVFNIRRYTRKGDYYVNLYGTIKHTWANNVSVDIIITEFLHNEYRRSFIEFHYKLCDLINNEPILGMMLRLKGVVCPAPKGEYRLENMTVQSQNFPNVWPFEKGGADINVTATDTGELIGTAYVHMKFKELKRKG